MNYNPLIQCESKCQGTFECPCTYAANRVTTEDLIATMANFSSHTEEERSAATLIYKNRTLGAGWKLREGA